MPASSLILESKIAKKLQAVFQWDEDDTFALLIDMAASSQRLRLFLLTMLVIVLSKMFGKKGSMLGHIDKCLEIFWGQREKEKQVHVGRERHDSGEKGSNRARDT